MQKHNPLPFVDGRAVRAALAGGTLAVAVLAMLPAFVVALARDYGLSEPQIGYFSCADLGGMTIGSAVGAALLRSAGLRFASRLGLALAIVGNVASALVSNFTLLLVLRALAELGSGFAVTVCYVVLARSRHVDRDFCLWPVFQGLLGAVFIRAMPWLSALIGAKGVFVLVGVMLVWALALTRRLPETLHAPDTMTSGNAPREAWIALVAIFAFFIAQGAVWAYLGVIGTHAGVAPKACDAGLATATMIGIAAPLVASCFGARLGRMAPLMVGTTFIVVASVQLRMRVDPVVFAVIACLFTLAWNLTTPYQLSSLSAVDRDCRVVGLAACVSLAGLALGPLIAALFLRVAGLQSVIWLSCGLCLLSLAGMLPALASDSRSVRLSDGS